MTTPTIGNKVNIQIFNRQAWNLETADTFEGNSGVIVAISRADTSNGYKFGDRAYLVQFDEIQPKTWSNGSPHTHFWFDALDLIITGKTEEEPAHFWCCHCVKCEQKERDAA